VPAIIVVLAIIGLLVSNYQKEVGFTEPHNGGRAAVAAAAIAVELSAGSDAAEYSAFSDALLVAVVAERNAPLVNAADTRLHHQLTTLLNCLSAAREAWQTEIEGTWDPGTHGLSEYWTATHRSASIAGDGLTAAAVRDISTARARQVLKEAAELAD